MNIYYQEYHHKHGWNDNIENQISFSATFVIINSATSLSFSCWTIINQMAEFAIRLAELGWMAYYCFISLLIIAKVAITDFKNLLSA